MRNVRIRLLDLYRCPAIIEQDKSGRTPAAFSSPKKKHKKYRPHVSVHRCKKKRPRTHTEPRTSLSVVSWCPMEMETPLSPKKPVSRYHWSAVVVKHIPTLIACKNARRGNGRRGWRSEPILHPIGYRRGVKTSRLQRRVLLSLLKSEPQMVTGRSSEPVDITQIQRQRFRQLKPFSE